MLIVHSNRAMPSRGRPSAPMSRLARRGLAESPTVTDRGARDLAEDDLVRANGCITAAHVRPRGSSPSTSGGYDTCLWNEAARTHNNSYPKPGEQRPLTSTSNEGW